jgi:hypothetical protein
MYTSGMTTPQIALIFGVVPTTIQNWLDKAGVERRKPTVTSRKYHHDETAFSNPTAEGRYWIGFLMADGSVTGNQLDVRLGKQDGDHLLKLKKFLVAENPVREGTSRCCGRKYPFAGFSVRSQRLVDDLSRYGVVPNKSLTARASLLESDRDFWRGVVDGDGCLAVNGKGRPIFIFYGSQTLTDQFASFAKNIIPDCRAIPRPHLGIYQFRLNGCQAAKLAGVLYSDAVVALDRKTAKAESWKEYLKTTRQWTPRLQPSPWPPPNRCW